MKRSLGCAGLALALTLFPVVRVLAFCVSGACFSDLQIGGGRGTSGGGGGREERPRQPTAEELRAERERQSNQRHLDLGTAAYQAGSREEEAGRWEAAEAHYRDALAHWGPWYVCFRMGYVLDMQGKTEEAIDWYRNAITRTFWEAGNRDHLPRVHTNIGIAFLKLGKDADAAREFRRALELNAGYAPASESLALLRRNQDRTTVQKMASVLRRPLPEPAVPPITPGLGFVDPSGKAVDQAQANQGATGTGLGSTRAEGPITGHREDAAAGGRSVFDSAAPGQASRTGVMDTRSAAAVPAVQALTAHIPAAAISDPAIQTGIDWYRRRESDKAETRAKIDKVQGLPAAVQDPVQAAYKETLISELKQIEKDQDAARASIKRRLVQLDVEWIETAAPPDPSGRQEKKP
jgi:tetratricopeptide (TPR) repeat protein